MHCTMWSNSCGEKGAVVPGQQQHGVVGRQAGRPAPQGVELPQPAYTSSPVPCMISNGMAKILLYIRTDLRPLLIFTRRTRKLVPPRSRARNFPFSVGEKVGAAFLQHAQSRDWRGGTERKKSCRHRADSEPFPWGLLSQRRVAGPQRSLQALDGALSLSQASPLFLLPGRGCIRCLSSRSL